MSKEKIDGYFSKIKLADGKVYGIKAYVTEIHKINCNNCGAPFELKFGQGTCPYCDTRYSTEFKLIQD